MEVFLFPLVNVTLFPRTTKPLNIFEEKYLSMVRESLQSGISICLGYIDGSFEDPIIGEPPKGIRSVAGYGLPQIIEERSNGTMLIFLQGLGKVKLGNIIRIQNGFIVCEAEKVDEDESLNPDTQKKLDHLNHILTRWIRTHIPERNQQEVFLKNITGATEIIGAFASYLVRDYDLQQMVLEFNQYNDKINFLYRLFESAEITA